MTHEQLMFRARRKVLATLGISASTERKYLRFRAEAESRPAKDGEVLLYGPIVDDFEAECMNEFTENDTMVSPQAFRAKLNAITGDVVVRVNSPGGNWFEASSIQAALVERRNAGDDVRVTVDGLSASAASLVMLAGSEIAVAAMSEIMIHKAWAWAVGNSDDMRQFASLLDQADTTQVEMLQGRLGADTDVMALLKAETWYTATEAIEAGLADRKIELEAGKKDEPKARRNSSLSALFALAQGAA